MTVYRDILYTHTHTHTHTLGRISLYSNNFFLCNLLVGCACVYVLILIHIRVLCYVLLDVCFGQQR